MFSPFVLVKNINLLIQLAIENPKTEPVPFNQKITWINDESQTCQM